MGQKRSMLWDVLNAGETRPVPCYRVPIRANELDQEPTRAMVRLQLDTQLVTAAQFDAFVIDAFPDTYLRLCSGMARLGKTNLVLQLHSPSEIRQALAAFLGPALDRTP